MKILVVSPTGYAAWFSALFTEEGHEVDTFVSDKYKDVLLDIISRPFPLKIINNLKYERYDLAVFELTGLAKLASRISEKCPVIGDSQLADKLEDDRKYGIEIMEKYGINVPNWKPFSSLEAAIAHVSDTGKSFVFKPSGDDNDTASTYVSSDAEDMISYLKRLQEQEADSQEFILQEIVKGTEVSTEGFFNGEDWFFINNTLEEKKFMSGGIGPNTGCAGNVVWTYHKEPRIFTEGLKKLTQFLKDEGYRGMIDLNVIADSSNLYGLEWTPRLGYDASATQTLLVRGGYAEFLHDIATGKHVNQERWLAREFAASVRLSIPPYPWESENLGIYKKDIPINGIEPEELKHCYMYDAGLSLGGELQTQGLSGFIACPMTRAASIELAFELLKKQIKKIKIPNMQYRDDVQKCVTKRYNELYLNGWLS